MLPPLACFTGSHDVLRVISRVGFPPNVQLCTEAMTLKFSPHVCELLANWKQDIYLFIYSFKWVSSQYSSMKPSFLGRVQVIDIWWTASPISAPSEPLGCFSNSSIFSPTYWIIVLYGMFKVLDIFITKPSTRFWKRLGLHDAVCL